MIITTTTIKKGTLEKCTKKNHENVQ